MNINIIKLILSFNAIKVHILNQKQLYQLRTFKKVNFLEECI